MFDTFKRQSVAAVFVAMAAVAPAQATNYVITPVSRAGFDYTALWDINNLGRMVGYGEGGASEFAQGFIYDGTTFTSLTGPAGAISSVATGISDGGVVVGTYATSFTIGVGGNKVEDPGHGFIFAAGSYTTFDVAGGVDTQLRGISPDGRYLAGTYNGAFPGSLVGFVYDTFSSNLSIVSGPNSTFTIMQGINSSYVAVGSDSVSGPPTTLRPGVIYDINTGTRSDQFLPGASRTSFRAIDDAGNLAGWFRDAGGATHGFAGAIGGYDQIDVPGASLTYVEGNNNAGVLVGSFETQTQGLGFIARPVPEPGTVALLVGGLGLLAWRRGRRFGRSG